MVCLKKIYGSKAMYMIDFFYNNERCLIKKGLSRYGIHKYSYCSYPEKAELFMFINPLIFQTIEEAQKVIEYCKEHSLFKDVSEFSIIPAIIIPYDYLI